MRRATRNIEFRNLLKQEYCWLQYSLEQLQDVAPEEEEEELEVKEVVEKEEEEK